MVGPPLVGGDAVVAGAVDGVVVVVAGDAAWVALVLCVAATTTSAVRTASARTSKARRTGRLVEGVMDMVDRQEKAAVPHKLQRCYSPGVIA